MGHEENRLKHVIPIFVDAEIDNQETEDELKDFENPEAEAKDQTEDGECQVFCLHLQTFNAAKLNQLKVLHPIENAIT